MLPDRVSNPGPLTYESGALPIALRGPAITKEIKLQYNYSSSNRLGTMKISSNQRLFQPSGVSFYMILNSMYLRPIYETSVVRVFVLFSFSMFSDRRSLKQKMKITA